MPNCDHLKWVIQVVSRLINEGFSGSITLDFHKGDISKKFKKQTVEYADG